MKRTALLVDARYAEHECTLGALERPERILRLLPVGEDPRREGILRIPARPATREELTAVHLESHYERVAASAGREWTRFETDTSAGPATFETARLAAGGVLAVAEAVNAGEADNGLALVRPPGHHAESNSAMGFCFFNNVAVAAAALRRSGRRVAIVDWDVHHGNGTQEIFWRDDDVLFVSVHQHPLYPGTGLADERGEGPGEGTTLNVPLAAGAGDEEYAAVFERTVLPALDRFAPDFLLVSAGFDIHGNDPLGGMRVTGAGFALLTRRLLDAAATSAGGRLVVALEGGYDLDALEEGVRAVLDALGGASAFVSEASA